MIVSTWRAYHVSDTMEFEATGGLTRAASRRKIQVSFSSAPRCPVEGLGEMFNVWGGKACFGSAHLTRHFLPLFSSSPQLGGRIYCHPYLSGQEAMTHQVKGRVYVGTEIYIPGTDNLPESGFEP